MRLWTTRHNRLIQAFKSTAVRYQAQKTPAFLEYTESVGHVRLGSAIGFRKEGLPLGVKGDMFR